MIPASDYQNDGRIVRRRLVAALGFVGALAVILVARLAWVQIAQHEKFSTLARENHIQIVPLPPVRGLIYDRRGAILADNRHAYSLQIQPEQVADMDATLAQIGELIAVSEEDLWRFSALIKRRPAFEWQTLRGNLGEEEASRIALHLHHLTGVELRARLQRNYPEGALTGHVVGYVGRVSADDLKVIDRQNYRGVDYIGRSGIEEQYESILRGKPGFERVEINAHGKAVRSIDRSPPHSGRAIHLSVDMELQRQAVAAMDGFEGAVVALEPDTGEVLAFAGVPSFDPNPFVNGIDAESYAKLRESPEKPLLNRALYGRYAPGSTIKGFLLLVGMENEIDPNKTVFCPGYYRLPNRAHRYRDWKKGGHGAMDGHDGIVQSCDVYFYSLARELGIDAMHDGMKRFGFGEQTGVDLRHEPSGLMPSPEWKQRARGEAWYPGETVITGIGQGYMLATPLQLAAATALLANRGRKVTPRFLREVEDSQTRARSSVLSPADEAVAMQRADAYDLVVKSMRDVVHGKRGTARRIGRGAQYQIAGKTGTAQVKSIPQGETYDKETVEKRFADHSLFIGFAPVEEPKIAIAVIAEHAGSGSATAAPIARKLMDFYLLERLGLGEGDDVVGVE